MERGRPLFVSMVEYKDKFDKCMSGFESVGRNKVEKSNSVLEAENAEKELQELLDNPDNAFLNEVKANREFIDSADTLDALAFAKKKIEARLDRTTEFQSISTIEGITLLDVDFAALKRTVDSILANQLEIGRGGDAFVVIDKNEVRDLPPEICYKFALNESTPRGRNSTKEEAAIQGQFYDAARELSTSKIGVPIPFYSLELSGKKMIAMEKLPARSIDDILRGRGRLPSWFDADQFIDELQRMLAHLHQKGLYHRDMHFGNVMIAQTEDLRPEDKWGYVIDFGLSGYQQEEEFAYEKQVAGNTFTYESDYGILDIAKVELKKFQQRQGV